MLGLHAGFAGLALVVGVATAQDAGWAKGQVNATMCQWQEPRVAVIRDTVYIDGGYLYWEPGMSDSTYNPPTQDNNPDGLVYLLNFSIPFNTSQNISDVFTRISKAPNGGAANNFAQNFYDGAMFANDGEWYTYGGMVLRTAGFQAPASNAVEGYEQYWYGAEGKQFSPGFYDGTLSANVTRYISGGGGVSVPSENKGYYFSGLKAPGSGEIFYTTGNETTDPTVVSNTLITLDMTTQRSETWSNKTLPTSVPGRANPELVWIPQGKEGLLVAIGGVIDPVFAEASLTLNNTQKVQSQTESPSFMSTVSVYDIAADIWYNQETSGEPPTALTQGCTVVASAQDGSSHSIYWYGGFDGIDLSAPFSDDVYILSLPSFMWMKVLSGNSTHGRAGHKCVKPYPDQMIVIGGYPQYPTTGPITCLENTGIVQILNLSNPQWMTSYDPSVWSNYSVPSMITNMIGGSGNGGATVLPSKWDNASLASVFATSNKYDSSKIKDWFPYAVAKVNNTNPRVPDTSKPSSGGGGIPKWVPPVLGVVLGLVLVSALVVIFLLFRRRRYLRSHPDEMTNTTDLNRHRIASWLRGAGAGGGPDGAKAPTVTSSEESPDVESTLGDATYASHPSQHAQYPVVEAASTQVHEMMDTSRPQEMAADPSSGTGLAFLTAGNLLSKSSKSKNRTPKPSRHTSHTSQSTVSDVSSPVISPSSPGRPDSPSLGADEQRPGHSRARGSEVSSAGSADVGESRIVSGVSATSAERGVLGQLDQDGVNPHGVAVLPGPGLVSPPTPLGGVEGRDYVSHSGGSGGSPGVSPGSAGAPGSPRSLRSTSSGGLRSVSGGGKRMSNFGEHLDEN